MSANVSFAANVTQIKSGTTINNDVNVKIRQKIIGAKKNYIWNHDTCSCKYGKYLRSIGYSVDICDEIIDTTKTVPTKNFPT